MFFPINIFIRDKTVLLEINVLSILTDFGFYVLFLLLVKLILEVDVLFVAVYVLSIIPVVLFSLKGSQEKWKIFTIYCFNYFLCYKSLSYWFARYFFITFLSFFVCWRALMY